MVTDETAGHLAKHYRTTILSSFQVLLLSNVSKLFLSNDSQAAGINFLFAKEAYL
jgi:hypothetical protein